MKKFKVFTIIFVIIFAGSPIFGQEDTIKNAKNTGWQLGGVLPAVAYDSDVGFRYGALASFYDYGDGETYPDYLQKIYVEWSNTTKGSMKSVMQFDNKQFLGTKLRVIGDFGYYTEKALDFYGFNGYEVNYNSDFETDDSPLYKSRMYYRQERKLFKSVVNVQGEIILKKLKWLAGYGFYSTKISSVNIEKMNEGKDDKDKLPTIEEMPGLYENYINWGIISEKEKNGGNAHLLTAGLVYDTRNFEAFPSKGIWTEAMIITAPKFSDKQSFIQILY